MPSAINSFRKSLFRCLQWTSNYNWTMNAKDLQVVEESNKQERKKNLIYIGSTYIPGTEGREQASTQGSK